MINQGHTGGNLWQETKTYYRDFFESKPAKQQEAERPKIHNNNVIWFNFILLSTNTKNISQENATCSYEKKKKYLSWW